MEPNPDEQNAMHSPHGVLPAEPEQSNAAEIRNPSPPRMERPANQRKYPLNPPAVTFAPSTPVHSPNYQPQKEFTAIPMDTQDPAAKDPPKEVDPVQAEKDLAKKQADLPRKDDSKPKKKKYASSDSSESSSDDEDVFGNKIQTFSDFENEFCGFLPKGIRVLIKLLLIWLVFFSPVLIYSIINGGFDYDLFKSRNGIQQLTFMTELCRYLLLIGGSLTIYEISYYSVEGGLTLIKNIPRTLKFIPLRKSTLRTIDYLLGVKGFWSLFVFWLLMHLLVRQLVLDHTFRPPPKSPDVKPSIVVPSTGGGTTTIKMVTPGGDAKKQSSSGGLLDDKPEAYATNPWVFYSHVLTKFMALYYFFLACQKTLLHVLAVNFHKTAFQTKIRENHQRIGYTETLLKASRLKLHFGKLPASEQGHPKSLGGLISLETNKDVDLPAVDLTSASDKAALAAELSKYSDTQALEDAKRIYRFLTVDYSKGSVTAEDLRPVFSGNSDVVYAALFQREDVPELVNRPISPAAPDSTAQTPNPEESSEVPHVSRAQTKKCIQALYVDKRNLSKSLDSHGKIVRKLDGFLYVFVIILCMIFGFGFLGITSAATYIASIGSFTLGFTFIFGGFAKSIFDDIVFLFITHLYDIGDTLLLDNTELVIVSRIDLLTTYFIRVSDGQSIAIPTSTLISKNIYNVKRSGQQTEILEVVIAANTTADKIYALRKGVTDALAGDSKDFTGRSTLSGFDIDGEKMKIRFSVEHTTNFSDPELKSKRHSKIKLTLKGQLEAHDIKYFIV